MAAAKKYTQAQAREIRGLLDAIIEAWDTYHGGDLDRALDQAKERLLLIDEYRR